MKLRVTVEFEVKPDLEAGVRTKEDLQSIGKALCAAAEPYASKGTIQYGVDVLKSTSAPVGAPSGQKRGDIHIGDTVDIVLKADQRTGKLTRGTVARKLTNSATHPRGIKVMLTDGQVGRVQAIIRRGEEI